MTGSSADPPGSAPAAAEGVGRTPTAQDQAWVALAAELTPAKSLQRLDAASGRVVSTISIVATLLTGFGLIAAGLTNLSDTGKTLAALAAGGAFAALVAALVAQIVTITRRLNTRNLDDVKHWYTKQFLRRAPLTIAASVLIVVAAGFAGIAMLSTLTAGSQAPTLAVTRTTDPAVPPTPGSLAASAAAASTSTVTVDITFHDLTEGQVATLAITGGATSVASAGFTAAADGSATRSVTASRIPAMDTITVEARAGAVRCSAILQPGSAAQVSCVSGP